MDWRSASTNDDAHWFHVGLKRSATAAFVLCLERGDRFGYLLDVNDALIGLFGYPRELLLATPAVGFGRAEEFPLLEQNLVDVAMTSRRRRIELWRRIRHADGHDIDVRLEVTPARNDDGEVVLAVVQVEPLSVIEEEEREARTNEQRYRRAFTEAPFPMAWVTIDGPETGRFLGANKALCELTGYTEAELIAMPPGGLTHPDEVPLDQGRLRDLLATSTSGPSRTERHIRRADGSSLWVRLSFAAQRNAFGIMEYGMLHAEDITAAKHAELALQASRERMQRTFQNAPIAMLLVDLVDGQVGNIIEANPAASALFGYERNELVGMSMLELTNPDNKLVSKELIEELGVDGEVNRRKQQRYRHASGREILGEVSISLVRDVDGRPAYGIGQIIDVTEHRATEARLRQAERLESVGQLAGGIAHDVNNLLAGIVNCAGLLTMNIEELPAGDEAARSRREEMLSDAQDIIDVSFRGAELTRQLLTFSRRERVTLKVLDLNTVVEGMQKLLGRTIGENIDLRVELAAGQLLVKADRGQLEQVVLNLVVNARDAMPDGGRLAIRTSTDPSGSQAVLTVADSGAGMSSAVASRAFEPFFTTKAIGHNSGLGLATVYGIVTQAGGEIAIESAPSAGTTMTVTLPLTEGEPDETDVPASPMQRMATGQTILLVEDEASVREPTARLLRRHGFDVVTARDADGGIAASSQLASVEVLVTDVVLPGRSGKELAAQLSREHPGIKVVFISGYSPDVIERRGVLAPDAEVVEKPFTGTALLDAVWRVLES